MHEDLDDTNDPLNSTKNSISPPASSFDSANSTGFSKSPSHTAGNGSIKNRDAQTNSQNQINTHTPLGPTSATTNAALPLW